MNTFLHDRKYLGWAQVMSNIIFVNANNTLFNNFLLEMIFKILHILFSYVPCKIEKLLEINKYFIYEMFKSKLH